MGSQKRDKTGHHLRCFIICGLMFLFVCRHVLQVSIETPLGCFWESVFPVAVMDTRTSVWMVLESVWWESLIIKLKFLTNFPTFLFSKTTFNMFCLSIVHQNCLHDTIGNHCEGCKGGFHSNNSLDGQAVFCSSCPCPLRAPSNKSVYFTSF